MRQSGSVQCDWNIYPMFGRRLKGRIERCANQAQWNREDESGTWHLCDHHKARFVESMNEHAQKKENQLWKTI